MSMEPNPQISVQIEVEVTDRAALWEEAFAKALSLGLSEDQATEWMGTKDQPDLDACLRQILDPGQSPPGCVILDSVTRPLGAQMDAIGAPGRG